MTKTITLPSYSSIAHRAGKSTGSPLAIVITMNEVKDTWEARVWGKNDAFAHLAGLAADAALLAVNDMQFPADIEQTMDLLTSKGATKQ